MKKIVKSLGNNKLSKDNKLILCYITVIITTITLFVALNALPVLEASISQDLRQTTVGKSDYIIKNSEEDVFIKPQIDGADIVGILAINAKIEGSEKAAKVMLWGLEYDEFLDVFGETNLQKGHVKYPDSLEANQIMISPDLAEKIGAVNGKKLTIELLGETEEYEVILAPEDNFFVKANEEVIILNYDTIRDLLGVEDNNITVAYAYNVHKDADIKGNIDAFNKNLQVNDAIDKDYIDTNMKTYYGVDAVIFIFILLISFDILKSIGLIFIAERSKFIGTLRTNGAEKKQIIRLFNRLGLSIALKSMIIGMIIGTVVIVLFSKFGVGLANPFGAININFLIVSILCTGAIILLLTKRSFTKPVKNILKKSDRALIIENSSADIKRHKVTRFSNISVIGTIALIIGSYFINSRNPFVVVAYVIVLIFLLKNAFTGILAFISKALYKKPKKGFNIMALKNICSNIYLKKTLTLTTVICLFITIVGTLNISVLSAMTSFYKDYKSDAFVRAADEKGFSEKELEAISKLNSIDSTYNYSVSQIKIVGKNDERTVKVFGIDDIELLDEKFMKLNLQWEDGFNPNDFSKGKNIVLSEILSRRFDVKPGEYITLTDKNVTSEYYVAGICKSLQDLGDILYMVIDETPFTSVSKYNSAYLLGENPEIIEAEISGILSERMYIFKDVTELQKNDLTNGMQLIIFFIGFSILVAITSISGIYSNYKLSYMSRKKEFAIMMSNGYTRKNIISLFLREIFISSIIGYGVGAVTMIAVKRPLEMLMELVDLPIKLNISMEILLSLLFIIIVVAIINIILACRVSNLDKDKIIQTLKM